LRKFLVVQYGRTFLFIRLLKATEKSVKMSEFLKNNEKWIHIAAEVIVIGGVIFWFSQKHKALMQHLENLAQRIEAQDELLQRHDQVLKMIMSGEPPRGPRPSPQGQQGPQGNPEQVHSRLQGPQGPQGGHEYVAAPTTVPTAPVRRSPSPEYHSDSELDRELQGEFEEMEQMVNDDAKKSAS